MYRVKIFVLLLCVSLSFQCSEKKAEHSSVEKYRPGYHFTPPIGWMNDPNGMFFYKKEYHLFYQYYPDSTVWGPMHWGHAVSNDLVSWKHLPIALYPDSLGYIFSGSAVVDIENTSGFGSAENPPIVAIFTHHNMERERAGDFFSQCQSIAYSNDGGYTWNKYAHNPVLDNPGLKDFRDPKVFWFSPQKKWIMSLAVGDHINFYSSKNLKEWGLESEFGHTFGWHGGVWECPDLFPLVDMDTQKTYWVLLVSINPGAPKGGSATQYFVGNFDGKTFTALSAPSKTKWLDAGRDNYAGVTWGNIPESDGRKIFFGWMSNWKYSQVVPTEGWRSSMTIPRTLHIKQRGGEPILISQPVQEIETMREKAISVPSQEIESRMNISSCSQIDITILKEKNKDFIFSIGNNKEEKISFTFTDTSLYFDRKQSGIIDFQADFADTNALHLDRSVSTITLFLDKTSVEAFFNDGELVMTETFFPTEPFHFIEFLDTHSVKNITITPLRSPFEAKHKK
ncbi:MAG: glycoside hydrolase family 32 protein [Chitinophagaceae bacterium]|nr:glycoside hydrolase family 32 protein [Chitinophagaceae bacterium]